MRNQHGGARKNAGRKSKYNEETKPMRIPLSKLPLVADLIENDTPIDILSEFSLIEAFLFWAAREKGVCLCEWFEGHDHDGIKIPKGFIKYAGSYQMLFEEYKDLKTNSLETVHFQIS